MTSGIALGGSRVLVTGATGGIGSATARALSAAGASLALHGRSEEALEPLVKELRAVPIVADLVEEGAAETVVELASTELGGLDVLVSVAGAGWAGPFGSMDRRQLEEIVTLDLTVPLRLCRAALPHLLRSSPRPAPRADLVARVRHRRRPDEPRHLPGAPRPLGPTPPRPRGPQTPRAAICLVASVAGHVGVREEVAYSAAKAGLLAAAEGLAEELWPFGIGVSVVSPGAVTTGFFARRGRPYERRFPKPIAPERVAAAIVEVLQHGTAEVVVPGWLRVPAVLRAASPALYRALARRLA